MGVRNFAVDVVGMKKVKRSFKDKETHKLFFDRLGEQLGYKCMEDWYNLTTEMIENNGGKGILRGGNKVLSYYKESTATALQNVYPNHKWDLWKFKLQVPLGYWKNSENRTAFFDWLGGKLGYTRMEDWYNVTVDSIAKNRGAGLLYHYKDSPSAALQSAYPQHKFELWKFKHVPAGYWKDNENRVAFFDWIGNQLGYKCLEDWYQVSHADVCKYGGRGLLCAHYNDCVSAALKDLYPQHNWMLWRFKIAPFGYMKDLMQDSNEIRRLVDWLSEQLSINSLDDWYRVSLAQVRRRVLVVAAEDLSTLLHVAYPQHEWKKHLLPQLGVQTKASQREVLLIVQQLFPNHSSCNVCRSDVSRGGREFQTLRISVFFGVINGVGCIHRRSQTGI